VLQGPVRLDCAGCRTVPHALHGKHVSHSQALPGAHSQRMLGQLRLAGSVPCKPGLLPSLRSASCGRAPGSSHSGEKALPDRRLLFSRSSSTCREGRGKRGRKKDGGGGGQPQPGLPVSGRCPRLLSQRNHVGWLEAMHGCSGSVHKQKRQCSAGQAGWAAVVTGHTCDEPQAGGRGPLISWCINCTQEGRASMQHAKLECAGTNAPCTSSRWQRYYP